MILPNVMSKGKLSPLLTRQVVAWAEGKCPPPTSHPSMPEMGREASPGIIREGGQSLPGTNCSTQKRGPCNSREQHNRTDTNGIGV